MLGEGQRCLMKDVQSNQFTLIQDKSQENTILREVIQESPFLSQESDKKFKFFTRSLSYKQLEQLQNSKQTLIDSILEQSQQKKLVECEQVAILKALEKRNGTLVMTNLELVFVYDIKPDSTNSTIFFFQWQPKKLTKTIKLSDIREIQKRRFLGQNKVLELFLMSNKTILIDFNTADQRD